MTHEIFRVETQDGGDAKVEVSPRDIVYAQPAELVDGEEPEILHKLDLRYGYRNDLWLHLFIYLIFWNNYLYLDI